MSSDVFLIGLCIAILVAFAVATRMFINYSQTRLTESGASASGSNPDAPTSSEKPAARPRSSNASAFGKIALVLGVIFLIGEVLVFAETARCAPSGFLCGLLVFWANIMVLIPLAGIALAFWLARLVSLYRIRPEGPLARGYRERILLVAVPAATVLVLIVGLYVVYGAAYLAYLLGRWP